MAGKIRCFVSLLKAYYIISDWPAVVRARDTLEIFLVGEESNPAW